MNAASKSVLWKRIYHIVEQYYPREFRVTLSDRFVFHFPKDEWLWKLTGMDDSELEDFVLDTLTECEK